jgi:hypothetical protein
VSADTAIDTAAIGWCAVDAQGGGQSSCADDPFEPNDAPSSAKTLASGTYEDLALCSADEDHYRFTVPSGHTLTVSIDFDHAEGDLDLELYAGNTVADGSYSVANSESVSASGSTTYIARVYGYSGAAARYTLSTQ